MAGRNRTPWLPTIEKERERETDWQTKWKAIMLKSMMKTTNLLQKVSFHHKLSNNSSNYDVEFFLTRYMTNVFDKVRAQLTESKQDYYWQLLPAPVGMNN